MLALDLYGFRDKLQTRAVNSKTQIFCIVRKQWVSLEPEEVVRQLFLQHCITVEEYPTSLISVEKAIIVNGLTKRYDIAVYDRSASPLILVECKAPTVTLDDQTLFQATQYNSTLVAPFLVVTNGMTSFGFSIDHERRTAVPVNVLPAIPAL